MVQTKSSQHAMFDDNNKNFEQPDYLLEPKISEVTDNGEELRGNDSTVLKEFDD